MERGLLGKMEVTTTPIFAQGGLGNEEYTPTDWRVNANDPAALTRLLDLPELQVTHLELDVENARLVLHCLPIQATATCPTCGQASAALHQAGGRTVRDLPWADWHCFVQFPTRRFWCRSCARPFSEPFAAIAPYARTTRRYAADLFAQCRDTIIQQVARREDLGYKAVEGLYYRQAEHDHPPGPPPDWSTASAPMKSRRTRGTARACWS